jgi:hypothetical protein
LREELASELRLDMAAHTTATDLVRLHDGFDAAYKSISNMIGSTMKQALIRDAAREKVLGPVLPARAGPVSSRYPHDLRDHGLRP